MKKHTEHLLIIRYFFSSDIKKKSTVEVSHELHYFEASQ